MTEHDGAAAPFLDVPIHLLLHLLALEFNIGSVEVFRANPRNGLVVDVDVVQEEQIRGTNRTSEQFRLFLDHLGLTS